MPTLTNKQVKLHANLAKKCHLSTVLNQSFGLSLNQITVADIASSHLIDNDRDLELVDGELAYPAENSAVPKS